MGYAIIITSSILNVLIIWHYIRLAKRLKTIFVLTRQYKTLFPFCFLIVGISNVIYGLLKVLYPNEEQPLVGRDVSISLMAFTITGFGFTGLVIYLHAIIEFLKGYSRMMILASRERIKKRLNILGRMSWFIPPAVFSFGILPLIANGISSPSQSERLGKAHLIGFSLSCLSYTLICCNCLSLLIKELRIHNNSTAINSINDVKVIIFRLNVAYCAICSYGSVAGLLLLVFGCSDYLFNLTTYFLLFAYTSVSPGLYALVNTVSRLSTTNSKHTVQVCVDATEQPNLTQQSKLNSANSMQQSRLNSANSMQQSKLNSVNSVQQSELNSANSMQQSKLNSMTFMQKTKSKSMRMCVPPVDKITTDKHSLENSLDTIATGVEELTVEEYNF
jgi:hypothetical protein